MMRRAETNRGWLTDTEVEELAERIRQLSDEQILEEGRWLRDICDSQLTRPRSPFRIHLKLLRAEYRRRKVASGERMLNEI